MSTRVKNKNNNNNNNDNNNNNNNNNIIIIISSSSSIIIKDKTWNDASYKALYNCMIIIKKYKGDRI